MGSGQETINVFPGARRVDYSGVPEDIRLMVEEIDSIGYTLIPNFASEEVLDDLKARVDSLYDAQVEEFGSENLEGIGETGVCRSPFAYDDAFIPLIKNDTIDSVCQHYFGRVYLLHVQRAVLSMPNRVHGATVWHREPPYQNFTSSVPVALTTILFLDPCTQENDGIYVLDGSHRFDLFPSDEYTRRHQALVEAPAGSLLIFNSALFHRGGYNKSNTIRKSMVQIFSSPLLKQATEIPDGIDDRYRGDEQLEMLLGYTTQPDKGDLAYRKRKLAAKSSGY